MLDTFIWLPTIWNLFWSFSQISVPGYDPCPQGTREARSCLLTLQTLGFIWAGG